MNNNISSNINNLNNNLKSEELNRFISYDKDNQNENENEEEGVIRRNSNEIVLKTLKQILEENSDNPRLKEIIYNNSAKKITRLFIMKMNQQNLNLNNNSPSKLNKIANKKKDKNYTFISDNSVSDFIKDGFGIQRWQDGSKFVGYFKNCKSHGLGRFVDDENNYLLGNFTDDHLEGFGLYSNVNGTNYIGQWSHDCQDGIGIEHWKDGSFYSGEFSSGKKNGIGYYIWSDGSEYKGEWKNNYLKGFGIYSFSNKKKIYYGEWNNNMMHGFGELAWKNEGRKYYGFFMNDKRHGFGIYMWRNPFKVFLGFWIKGKQNGVGKSMDKKKNKYGIWKNGKLVKWFKNKDEAYQYIEPELNNYLIFFEKPFEEIQKKFIGDNNW